MREPTSQLPVFLHGPLVDPEILALVLGRAIGEHETAPAAIPDRRSARDGDALAACLVAAPGARAAGLILARPSGADRERLGRFAAPAALAEVQIELDDDFLIDAVVATGAAGRTDDGSADAWPADGLGETDRAAYLERLRAWLGQDGRERSPGDV